MRHKQLFTFGAAESLGRAFNWLTLAVLPFILPPSEYGFVGLIVAAEALLGSVVLVGHDRAILRFHEQAEDGIYRNSFVVPMVACLLLVGIVGVVGFTGGSVAGIRAWPDLFLLAVSIGFLTANKLALSRARAEADLPSYMILRAGVAFLKLLFAVVLALIWPLAASYLWALLASLVVVAVANAIRRRSVELDRAVEVDTQTVRRLFMFGWPFVFHVVSGNILVAADRFMLQYFAGEAVVGEYTLAYTIGFAVLFIYGALGVYLEPQIYKHSDEIAVSENLIAHHTFLCLVLGLVVGAFAMAGYDLLAARSLDSGYLASRSVIPVIIAGYLLHPVYNQGIFRLTSVSKTKVIAVASGFAALTNIVLNYFLIPPMGTMGAALATFLSYMILAVATLVCSIALTDRGWGDIVVPWLVIGSFLIAVSVVVLAQVLPAALVFLAFAVAVVLLNPARSARYFRQTRALIAE